jgi:hypothetical protein
MTDGPGNILPTIGGLVGIGIMAGAASAVIKQTQKMSGGKKRKNKKLLIQKKLTGGFADSMDERIKRMI